MTNKNKILRTFKQKGGIVKLKEITEQGINKYHLLKLVETGEVEKLKHGIYKLTDYQTNEYLEIKSLVPNGIICLFSAWNYYELTTYLPHEFHVAIKKKSKVKLPDYPPIKLYYWDNNTLNTGVKNINFDNFNILIYDIEKSVCDAVKFRNKIGKDILNEILTEYLKRKNRNLDLLIKYSKILRVEKILKNYLDVLL
ncbi:MAG: type IV toxin-antitoxin system AbiEi family antitoxin domain-containing protein [Bacteroidales bacterium]|nr:type IV toxin-antitoxin system AbiEi family antitoxin domain-containing protein [Bacteroidales bacterium]